MEDTTQCVEAKKVSLAKPEPQTPHAMSGGKNNWKIGHCLHCSSEFEKRTVWQVYCREQCRQDAYVKRTGKDLKFKKKA